MSEEESCYDKKLCAYVDKIRKSPRYSLDGEPQLRLVLCEMPDMRALTDDLLGGCV